MTGPVPSPLLLIEDTPSLQMVYRSVLQTAGHTVQAASNAAEGMRLFQETGAVTVLLDLMLPDRDGLAVMREMLALRPETRVIVITANASINRAVEAMRAGAHDFLVKPFDEVRFLGAVANASGATGTLPKPAQKRAVTAEPDVVAEVFIGSSAAMRRVQTTIRSVAGSMATVFITGESGTGKELCAVAVHAGSPRAGGPFIALNCGAIPQDLLESEVFGHMKGSFTGAISDKQGAAAAADGGTLFLDEICEMAPALQTKLLRFLQTSTVQPVGAVRPRKVNVRIVCATNRDPAEAVRRGEFREDLYYRLFVVPVHMPALRDRGEDVVEIAEIALERFAREEGRQFDGFDPEVLDLFRRLSWPGNVRQVLNVIRNIVVLHPGGRVTLAMLPDSLQRAEPVTGAAPKPDATGGLDSLIGRSMAEIERLVIEETIARNGGSVPKAARVLELSPSTIYRKLEGWGLKPQL
ncbi:sigma-54-dependent transcriptional regulator [Pseudotabrizicola alkalilacus]|uniref:Nif-specific regulatory protein n=1 Tax=Pseudotabrizicola alkalilacus TaxID=2305252 RepID=A0A411Z733_9RHOB|nr:sigma-54 dependent transcriptional regulator [Pseudotabrizicola alkalilacus]RGP38864.1 sigma-54-dependent Fis family transcriptional regulator [Pseudotabrizicola alkalilacus]